MPNPKSVYIWCYVTKDYISPQGHGKSLEYALSIKHNRGENWKLYKLVRVKEAENETKKAS